MSSNGRILVDAVEAVPREPTGVACDRQRRRIAPGVARDVRQRLLSDAIYDQLGFAVEVRHRRLNSPLDQQSGALSKPIAERGQRAGATEILERLRS